MRLKSFGAANPDNPRGKYIGGNNGDIANVEMSRSPNVEKEGGCKCYERGWRKWKRFKGETNIQ